MWFPRKIPRTTGLRERTEGGAGIGHADGRAHFDAHDEPAGTDVVVLDRMWMISSGQDRDPRYARLSADDRRDIIQILRETKKRLPVVFQ